MAAPWAKRFPAEVLDIFADHQGTEFDAQLRGQLRADAEQFPGDLGRLPFGLFDKDPDTAILGERLRQRRGFRVDFFLDRAAVAASSARISAPPG